MAKNMAEVAEETARNAADAGWSVLVLRLHQKGEFKVTGSRPPSEAAWDVAGAIAAVERVGWRLEHFNGGVSTWMHGGRT
jgi:hypothetical protein